MSYLRDLPASEVDMSCFDDFEDFVPGLFDVWWSGSEVAWAAHAWEVLAQSGLTSYADELGRAVVLCRLVALAAINREFAARARDEGYAGAWRAALSLRTSELVGDHPAIDPFVWGMLAQREKWEPPFEGESPEIAGLIIDVAAGESSAVAGALLAHLGEAEVFAGLWWNAAGDTRYPLSDELVDEAVNVDATSSKVDGYMWVEDGLSI